MGTGGGKGASDRGASYEELYANKGDCIPGSGEGAGMCPCVSMREIPLCTGVRRSPKCLSMRRSLTFAVAQF